MLHCLQEGAGVGVGELHCLQEGAGVEELTKAHSCLRDQLPAQARMEAVLDEERSL